MNQRLDPLTLPLWGSRLIEASAGTGKTWTIAALYLRLVLGHGDPGSTFGRPLTPPQILVMTFTRAATRELSERIRTRLVEAASCFRGAQPVGDDPSLAALVASFPAGHPRDEAAWRLAMAAEGMDDGAVFTIDAWVQRMLREHAFDSGCLFDEEVQADERKMLEEAARDYWRQEVYPLAADRLDGVLSVWPTVDALIADAGALIAHFGESPDDGRSLEATWLGAIAERDSALASLKAPWPVLAAQMRGWLLAQLDSKDRPFNGNKLQGRFVEIWMSSLDRWAATPGQRVPTLGRGAHRLSRNGIGEALKPGHAIDIPHHFDALQSLLESLRHLAEPAHAIRRHAAIRVAARLQAAKQRAGIYGFADMQERLDRALNGPGGERLRTRIVAQYPVALIDEFQDTSALQYRIFDRLYRVADDDRTTALMLIGDPKQSIYRFRGADIDSYLHARAAMAGRHHFLSTNYRATTGLVDVVNHLFGRAESRADGAFRYGRGTGASGDGVLPFFPVVAQGRRETFSNAAGPVPALTLCHDSEPGAHADVRRRFAERCAEHVATQLDDVHAGFVDPIGGFARLRPADITILVRDRREAAAIRRALRNRRIASVYLSDRESVFASAEAADLLHWLRAVADPLDSRRARVAYATALVGLPLDRLIHLSHDDVAFERRLDELRTLNGTWRRQGVLPMLRRTLHLLDLPARWLAEPDGERRLTNVLHLAELLQAAGSKLDGEQAVIRWFADQLAHRGERADEQIVRLESDADLVKVVTIHKAKGLEYPVVYLPFVCSYRDERWPAGRVAVLTEADGSRTLSFDATDEVKARVALDAQREDIRLLYVALTRARHALWLGIAPLRVGADRQCDFHRSAFGYLVSGDEAVEQHRVAALLTETFAMLPSVVLEQVDGPSAQTRLPAISNAPALLDAADYAGSFERDWSIGSFSAMVRDLGRGQAREPASGQARGPAYAPADAPTINTTLTNTAMVEPALEEELLSSAAEIEVAVPSGAPRHRFPRGALAGNFLHDQLEWLAGQRFASTTDPGVRDELMRRCARQGWGHRASDVAAWLGEVVTTRLPPIGRSLRQLEGILPEMEFWFPSEGAGAGLIDDVCRRHLLDGHHRPPLPDRVLRGMLMGFADLVFEADGRYWILDYKSNALGVRDDDYTREALEQSMAAHRYDVQGALYLLALHRLLRQRLGDRYDPARQLGGALYLFLRGIEGPAAGCYVVPASATWLDALDDVFALDIAGGVSRA